MNPKNLKISQFEFLVMTVKIIFADQLFLSLNISDFNLLFMWKLQLPPAPKKSHHTLSQQPPSKSWGPVKPPLLFENLVGGSTPSAERGWGAHHDSLVSWDITPPHFFLAETLYTFSKSSLSKYKFGEISPEQSKVSNFALWWVPFVKIK